jgi:hypothetical protein
MLPSTQTDYICFDIHTVFTEPKTLVSCTSSYTYLIYRIFITYCNSAQELYAIPKQFR